MNARSAWLSLFAAGLIAGCAPQKDQSALANAPDTSGVVAANPSETQPLPAGTPEATTTETKTTTKHTTKTSHNNGDNNYTPPAAPKPSSSMVELTIPSGKAGGATLETALSSETSHVGDSFTATLAEDWTADGSVAIPAGTKVMGHVSAVKPRARGKSKAMLTLAYDKLGLPGGKTVDIAATPQVFEAGGDTQGDAAKILGGTAGGAIIGGATGNAKRGAVIGGAAGIGASLFSKGHPMDLAVGSKLTVTLAGDVHVTVKKVIS